LGKTVNIQPGLTARFSNASIACPYGKLLEILGKPHALEILYGLGIRSPLRFTEMQKYLDLQPKTVSARLRELVKLGLVARQSYNEVPPRVDYELTQKGRDLGKMFDALHGWARKYGYDEQPADRSRARMG
jgi:DNA-binding HxlR family transcriptional regulator